MESRLRASHEQFSLMLEFMESHGDLSRPQPGLQGRQRGDRLWQELSQLLNSVGGSSVTKSTDKWKRVWSDWKTKTKKKASAINRDIRGTGGGPSMGKPLNPSEERVFRFIGSNSITGQQAVQELGFDEPSQIHPQVEGNIAGLPSLANEAEFVPAPPGPTSSPLAHTMHTPATSSRVNHGEISPESRVSSPQHRRIRQRRLRQTPFDRATSEFAKIEQARIALERERDARLFELETERNRLESERLQVEADRVQLDRERLQVEAERLRVEEGRARTENERLLNERALSDSITLLNNHLAFIISRTSHSD